MDELHYLLGELEITRFMDRLEQSSSEGVEKEKWVILRSLTPEETRKLDEMDRIWHRLESLTTDAQAIFSPKRRAAIMSYKDLTERESDLLAQIRYTRARFQTHHSDFWSTLQFTYRHYQEVRLSTDKTMLMGRGQNRIVSPIISVGMPVDDENQWLRRLFGETD